MRNIFTDVEGPTTDELEANSAFASERVVRVVRSHAIYHVGRHSCKLCSALNEFIQRSTGSLFELFCQR